jgi:hypothetical protein
MQKAVALYDAGAPGAAEDSNVPKYAAGDPAINWVARAIHAHGATASRSSTASRICGGERLTRTAPVSREMILNYVAGHSPGRRRATQPAA